MLLGVVVVVIPAVMDSNVVTIIMVWVIFDSDQIIIKVRVLRYLGRYVSS